MIELEIGWRLLTAIVLAAVVTAAIMAGKERGDGDR